MKSLKTIINKNIRITKKLMLITTNTLNTNIKKFTTKNQTKNIFVTTVTIAAAAVKKFVGVYLKNKK